MSIHLGPPSTLARWAFSSKTHRFKNARNAYISHKCENGRKRIKMKTMTENMAGACYCSMRIELNLCCNRKLKQRVTHINQKWTFCILGPWFWPYFKENRLYEGKRHSTVTSKVNTGNNVVPRDLSHSLFWARVREERSLGTRLYWHQ